MDMKLLDAYRLKARYYPTVIVLAPVCLVILSAASGRWDLLKSTGVAAVSVLGLALVMEQVGRDQGKRKEKGLFEAWGGKPTTRILRHRDTTFNRVTLQRYHKKLAAIVDGVTMPTTEDEDRDPEAADAVYESCTAFLREKTRGKDFPLIFQENTNYGFRRNLWGMKPAGILLSVVGTLACSTIAAWYFLAGKNDWIVAAICGAVCTVLLVLWVCRFTSSWVRTTAEEYARQLLSACDSLRGHEQTNGK